MENIFLSGLISGERKTIKKIYEQFLPSLEKWVSMNNGSKADANDVFQEGLTQILISARKGNIKLKKSFGAYLITTCKYIWLGRIKKSKKLHIVKNEDFDTPDDNANAQDTIKKEYLLNTFLERTKNKLSDLCINIINLTATNTSPSEIAAQLNMSNANTVYRRKFACLKKWREHIEEDPLYHEWTEL